MDAYVSGGLLIIISQYISVGVPHVFVTVDEGIFCSFKENSLCLRADGILSF